MLRSTQKQERRSNLTQLAGSVKVACADVAVTPTKTLTLGTGMTETLTLITVLTLIVTQQNSCCRRVKGRRHCVDSLIGRLTGGQSAARAVHQWAA
jgi:hypothetical protein